MMLSRMHCERCREETLHLGEVCVHCGHRSVISALVPRIADFALTLKGDGRQVLMLKRQSSGGRASARLYRRRPLPRAP